MDTNQANKKVYDVISNPSGQERKDKNKNGDTGKSQETSGANLTNNLDKSTEPCPFYKEGRCKFGNECKFRHKGKSDKSGGQSKNQLANQSTRDKRRRRPRTKPEAQLLICDRQRSIACRSQCIQD